MKPESHRDIFEENLTRLLQAATGRENTPFQERLARTVGHAVDAQRRAARGRWLWWGFPAAIAAAAVVALAWVLSYPQTQEIDWVEPLYGAVEIVHGASPRPVAASTPVHAGESIRTLSGSKARVLAHDGSKLVLMPRTTLQTAAEKKGTTFKLREGTVTVEAAKQQAGRRFAVETPGARVRALGTVFDVRLVQKPDGIRQTRVGVTSGVVELESGGNKMLLGANTEGLADEGHAPQRRLADSDLEAVLQLLRRTTELAQQLGKRAGSPGIVQFRNADVAVLWTVVCEGAWRPAEDGTYTLRLKSPAAQARLFTLEGLEVSVRRQGRDLTIDRSALSPGGPEDARFILQLQEVRGIVQVESGGMVRFTRPAGAGDVVTLLQFRLPNRANLEHIAPAPVETAATSERAVLTVVANIDGLEVWE